MPTTTVNAPDGGVISVNHPEGASDQAILQYAATMYGQDPSISKRPEEENITLTGRITETAKAVPRGFASGFLTAAEGLAELSDAATNFVGLEGLIDSGDENALISGARRAKEAVNSALGADRAYQDLWSTKFGEGLGSFATFLTPGAAFRLAGNATKAAKATTGLAKLVGAGSAAEAATVATLATGTGAGEQAERIRMARESGVDISQAQEDSAIALASLVGLSELAPVERLFRKLDKNLVDGKTLNTIGDRIKSALGTGGVEAVQEAVAGLSQDLIEKNIYNEELPIGESLYDDFTVGGAVGFVSDLVLNAAAGRRRKVSKDTETEYERKIREDNARAAQDQAELVSAIDREEVLEPQTIFPDQDDVQGMPAYARKIARDMGQNFPLTTSFNVQETTETVTRTLTNQAGETIQREEQVPAFVATDSSGRIYGKSFDNYEQAAVFAGALNDQLINRAVSNSVSDIIDTAPQSYDQPTFQTLTFWGNSALNPENNTVTSNALNMAAGTTITQGFNEQENAMNGATRVYNLAVRGLAPRNTSSLLTATQRANWSRLGRGESETDVFTLQEAKEILGNDLANLADVREDSTIETETYRVDKDKRGRPVVVSSAGEVITQRPTTLVERREKKGLGRTTKIQTEQQAQTVASGLNTTAGRAVDNLVFQDRTFGREEIKSLLEAKNVTDDLNSPQIKALAQSFTGKSGVDKMSRAEMKLFYLKLRSLPRFEVATSLPVFVPKLYTSQQFRLASQHIEQNPDFTNESLAEAIGISETDPRFEKKLEQINDDLNAQGVETVEVAEEPVIPVERRLPNAQEDITQQLEKQLSEEMDRLNLGDVKVNVLHALTNVVRDAEGNLVLGIRRFDPKRDQGTPTIDAEGNFVAEELAPDEQALYSRNMNEIFFGVDRLRQLSEEGATPEQLFETAKSLLNHESVHAMRMLDLWKDSEWSTLEGLARTKKNAMGRTYLEAAQATYSDLTPVGQMEEAVAELIRDGRNKFTGKPRTLIQRIKKFFESMLSFLRGTGYTSFDSLIGDIESGAVGARDRDEVRTLRATEAARGVVPERGILPRTRTTPRGAARERSAIDIPRIRSEMRASADPNIVALESQLSDDQIRVMRGEARPVGDFLEDFAFSRTPVTVPPPESDVPNLPIGDVERGLYSLISATGGSPTSEQLATIPGSPTKRKKTTEEGDKVPDNERDGEVKPTSLDDLRQYMRDGLESSDNLQWYDQFASGLMEIVGPANIEEASVIFGITSQQNSVEQNLADTLHIMSVARRIDPVGQTSRFMKEVKEGTRPGGQKIKITGDQIKRIVRMYKEGYADAGLKTSTYMQLIQDRARNKFNPFSVQDVHMARVFGFRRKNFDEDTGNLVDAAMIPGDLQYRYAQYLTSYLADEFNITPNQAQAALWFYGKTNLTSKTSKKEGAGTLESATKSSAKEIEVIEDQIASGIFNKNESLTPALKKGVRPRNAVRVKTNPYTNFINMPELEALAEARAPSITVSANPGNARKYGFPSTVTIGELFDFHEQALDAITDKDGQIPFLRRLGVPHKIELTAGTYEGLEPSFQIKLLGGTRDQALLATSILGDALLQDAAIGVRPSYKAGSQVGLAVRKPDRSAFTREELESIAATANPEKDPYGMNFTAVKPDTLVFMDGRTFDPDVAASYTPEMAEEFATQLLTSLDTGLQYDIQSYLQESDYVTKEPTDESRSYSEVVREIRDQGSVPGSSSIFDALDRELYKPYWDTYTQAADRIGFTPENTARPRVEELVRAPLSDRLPPPAPISQNAIDKAVEQNLQDVADAKSGAVPRYSTKASPEAQAVARNPEIGSTIPPGMEDAYSRKNVPDYEPDSVIPKLVDTNPQTQTAFEVYEQATGDTSRWTYYTTKFRKAFINMYARIESLSNDPYIKDAVGYLADVSANAALLFKDKSRAVAAAAIKYGTPVYRNGLTKVENFVNSKGEEIDGIIGLLSPLQASGNIYGKNLEEVAQAYAIGRRVKYLHSKGRYTDKIPIGKEDEYLAELEREADKYINPETNESIIREWYQNWSEYNDGIVKFLKDTGVITEEQGVEWASMSSYYPFYMEADGETEGIDFFSGLSAAPQTVSNEEFKAVGKSGKPLNVSMFDAIVRNITAAIDMGMTNVAYQRVVRDQVLLGQAREIRKGGSVNNKYTVNFRVNGQKRTFELFDPLAFEALKPISDGEAYEVLATILGAPANLLRETVTRDPGFIIVNMMRDTLSSYVTSGSKYKPVIDTVANFGSGMETLERYGIVGGYDLVNDPKDLKKFFNKELRRRGLDPDQGLGSKVFNKTLGSVWEMLGKATTMSDAATRMAVYKDVLARTGNEAEAAFQAEEVINFGRRGSNPVARLAFTAIPFLNARIQGLDVFYRAFSGKYSADNEASRKAIASRAIGRGLLLTSITGLYWGLVSDDDEYKLQSDEVRDNNWIIPTGTGYPIKIPIPFEVGLVFKTIPERAIDAAYGESTDAREMTESIRRGLMSTLEVNPLGIQAFAPIVEAAFNHNFYTGRQIVPYYMDQGLEQGFQSRVGTNKLAEYVGEALNISPMKIEHIISGYVGTIGGYGLDMIDKTLRSEALVGDLSEAMPALDMQQFPLMKRFFGTKEGSGVTQDFYEINREVNRVVQTLNSLKKDGKTEELQAFLMGREGLYSLRPHVNSLSKLLSDNRKRKETIMRMDIDPEEKRKLVDEIDAYNNDYIAPYLPLLRETANLPKIRLTNLYLQ